MAIPKPLSVHEFSAIHSQNELIIDLRDALLFGAAHIENSINMGSLNIIRNYASAFISSTKPFYLIPNPHEDFNAALTEFELRGLTNIPGFLEADFKQWCVEGKEFTDLPQVSAWFLDDLMAMGEKLTVIDVRTKEEFEAGHIAGAKHIFLGDIKTTDKLPKKKDEPVFCICGSGGRSSLAASTMQAMGYEQMYNLYGGMNSWKNAEFKVVK